MSFRTISYVQIVNGYWFHKKNNILKNTKNPGNARLGKKTKHGGAKRDGNKTEGTPWFYKKKNTASKLRNTDRLGIHLWPVVTLYKKGQ